MYCYIQTSITTTIFIIMAYSQREYLCISLTKQTNPAPLLKCQLVFFSLSWEKKGQSEMEQRGRKPKGSQFFPKSIQQALEQYLEQGCLANKADFVPCQSLLPVASLEIFVRQLWIFFNPFTSLQLSTFLVSSAHPVDSFTNRRPLSFKLGNLKMCEPQL